MVTKAYGSSVRVLVVNSVHKHLHDFRTACALVMCANYCPLGYRNDDNGCPTCDCIPPLAPTSLSSPASSTTDVSRGMKLIVHSTYLLTLSRHIQPLIVTRRLRSSATPRVCKPTTRTNFADRAFRCSAPAVWNSLTADIVDSCSLRTFKRKLKIFLFRHAFSSS